ncbi:hypothetical protein HK098_003534 [Nowakowskiella sp. JEL0407]|nr:hypothetical protein HK098_003534 [Nowakowskiella sp. JEL0407]
MAGILIEPKTPPLTTSYVLPDSAKYDYSELLHKSFLFYHAQISGKLTNRRLAWRGDSCFDCVGTYGEDLSKAWYEAANTMKWGLPLGFSATQLNWNIVEYADAMQSVNQIEEALFWVRQGADYFMNTFSKSNTEERLVGVFGTSEIGAVDIDFGYFGPPEEYEMWVPGKQKRIAYYCTGNATVNKGCSEVAGSYAAALASAAVVFRTVDPTYSSKCLESAKAIYDFGNKYRGTYNSYNDTGFINMRKWYPSTSYLDELALAAVWLHLATLSTPVNIPLRFGDVNVKGSTSQYLQEALMLFKDSEASGFKEYSWDDCGAQVSILLYKITSDPIYASQLKQFFNYYTVSGTPASGSKVGRTPRGLIYVQLWGSLRYAANVAYTSLVTADMIEQGGSNSSIGFTTEFALELRTLAAQQINYIAGDTNRSWIPGFGQNYPLSPYHKSSYNSFIDFPLRGKPEGDIGTDFLQGNTRNRFLLYGAVVGGPNFNDSYYDDRNAYEYTEVTQDYNAAFTGALAGLIRYYTNKKGGSGAEVLKAFSDCNLDLGWNHPNATGKPSYPADDCYHTCNKCDKVKIVFNVSGSPTSNARTSPQATKTSGASSVKVDTQNFKIVV